MLLGQLCMRWPLAVRVLLCKYDSDKLIRYRYREVLLSRLRTVSEATANDLEVWSELPADKKP